MRVSAKAEYACIAMVHLALHHGNPVPVRIKAIAEAHGIPQRFLVQILLQLKTAGLVGSVRGASGGYQLTRSPERISIAEIFSSVVDRTQTPRPDPVASPSSSAVRAVRSIWKELVDEEQRMLQRISLAELGRRATERSELSYQI